jgi:hypothetical protein
MTYAPQSLLDLGAYWRGQGGVVAGIVGSTKTHCKGYHLGRDRIFGDCACRPKNICQPGLGAADYSVQQPRDKAGLTDAASAIDLGKLDDQLAGLWDFSAWLARRAMSGTADTRDIRDIIFFDPIRSVVVGWSALDPDRLIVGYGDASHKTHTHISYWRDSEGRDKRDAFRAYFEEVVTDVNLSRIKGEDWVPAGATRRPVRSTPDRGAGVIIGYVEAGQVVRTIAEAHTDDGNVWRLTEYGGDPGWLLRSDLVPLVPGGDPVVDDQLHDYIARKPLDPTGAYADGWNDALVAAQDAVDDIPEK